jgi:hypothetical protein
MKIKISLENEGGELESRFATSEEEAAAVAAEMIAEAGLLQHGDKITVRELED